MLYYSILGIYNCIVQDCFSVVSARDEDAAEPRRRAESKQTDEYKMKAATNALLGGLFMVLDFIFRENMKYVDDYRYAVIMSVLVPLFSLL